MGIKEVRAIEERNNRLLKRKEAWIGIEFDGPMPSREEIKQALFDRLNMKKENMVIVRALPLYGTSAAKVLVHEYADKGAMAVAQKHIVARPNKKKGKKEAAPKQEAQVQEKKEEKKAEEAKQERSNG